MRKKYETHYFPITMVGGFFEEDYLLDFKELVMKDTSKTSILRILDSLCVNPLEVVELLL